MYTPFFICTVFISYLRPCLPLQEVILVPASGKRISFSVVQQEALYLIVEFTIQCFLLLLGYFKYLFYSLTHEILEGKVHILLTLEPNALYIIVAQ